jgi:hypothetical protein
MIIDPNDAHLVDAPRTAPGRTHRQPLEATHA